MNLKPPKKNRLFLMDLHIHSKYSPDSISEPKSIATVARLKGVNVIAVTDHNTIRGGIETKKYENSNLKVIVGSEIKTLDGEIIGLFLKKEIPPNLSAVETIKKIHSQDGLAIVPHPFDTIRKNSLGNLNKRVLSSIDGIEVSNARSRPSFNLSAHKFAHYHELRFTAGSDAHTLLEIGNACLQSHLREINSERELKKTLKKAHFGLYQKPNPHILYRPFDVLGRNIKRINSSESLFKVFNMSQEIISISTNLYYNR